MKKPMKRRAARSTTAAKDPAPGGRTVSSGTSVSNVLKTRHDTAKNSISDIR